MAHWLSIAVRPLDAMEGEPIASDVATNGQDLRGSAGRARSNIGADG